MNIQADALIAPAALEEKLADLLLAHPELSGGFTTLLADGHGASVALVGANENVRGRGRRVCFQLVLAREGAEQLVEDLRQALPDANVFVWMTDLVKCGRQVDVAAGDDRFREWDVALERAVRLPGKAGLDAQLGALRVEEAETAYGDARHEAARQLLQLWYGWLREQAAAEVLARQADALGRESASLARRNELGDASTLERMQGEAAYAQAQAAARQASGKEEGGVALLRGQFPDLPLPASPKLPEPSAAVVELPADALTENHELRRARVEAERRRLEARRAEADQHADPTVGVLYNRERGDEEKVLGLYVSIPFGGTGRRAAAEAGQAQTVAAEARALGVRRRVEAEWGALQAQARSALGYWQLAQDSATRLAAAADKVDRARRLGAADLAAVLVARRQANEAELQAAIARIDALESQRRFALDAHLLWDFDAQ